MIYRFDSCTLDLTRGCLEVAGREVELRPKCFDVLRHLVENGSRLISKGELVAAVWQQVVVTDESLGRCISDVRAAIADHEHKIIKTVPRRGYIFTAVVTRHEHAEPREQQGDREAVTGVAERPSIAVLAFINMGGDPDQEYFSDGITEDIITELSRFSELLVIARNSSFRYKGQAVDVRQVGRELGALYVLEGSVRRAGERIRISAQLIDAVTGAHRWAERYDRKLEDTFRVQDEVARTIVAVLAVLAVHVGKAETERVLAKSPSTWKAYDYNMRAVDILTRYNSSSNKEDLLTGLSFLRQALEIDSNYARAHAALSMTYVSFWARRWDEDGPWSAALDRAYQSARKAVRLAPNLPQAHVALGWVMIWLRQHGAAVAAFERALMLNPNLTNFRFAFTLILAGEPTRAIQTLEAHMRLDPFYDPYAPALLGLACYMLKRYEDALPHLQEGVTRARNMLGVRGWLAATYAQLGQLDSAEAEAMEMLRLEPAYTISRAPIISTLKRLEDIENIVDGLRKAGLPERPRAHRATACTQKAHND